VWRRTGAWRGWHRGEGRTQRGGGRSAAGLMPGAQPGWGSSRGWLDMVIGVGSVAGGRTRFADVGSDASAGASYAKRLQASELRPDAAWGRTSRR